MGTSHKRKETYIERKEKGLCMYCGEPKSEERMKLTQCKECAGKYKKNRKSKSWKYQNP